MREIKEDISESVVQAKKAQSSFEELFLVIKLIEGRMNSSASAHTLILFVCGVNPHPTPSALCVHVVLPCLR
jgi:hypothetical protein